MRRRLLAACGLLFSLLWPPFARAANSPSLPAAVHQAIAAALKTANFEVRHFQVTGNRASFASGTVLAGGRSCRVFLSRALPSPATGGRYGPWRVDWYSCSTGQAGSSAARPLPAMAWRLAAGRTRTDPYAATQLINRPRQVGNTLPGRLALIKSVAA